MWISGLSFKSVAVWLRELQSTRTGVPGVAASLSGSSQGFWSWECFDPHNHPDPKEIWQEHQVYLKMWWLTLTKQPAPWQESIRQRIKPQWGPTFVFPSSSQTELNLTPLSVTFNHCTLLYSSSGKGNLWGAVEATWYVPEAYLRLCNISCCFNCISAH